mmetsp:Transcript_118096/g.270933  ORF Transcript_118096/g.270933 Transcript_118096/m.270933 type:complete len:234 (+) Transcript_118096:1686-2387(+)
MKRFLALWSHPTCRRQCAVGASNCILLWNRHARMGTDSAANTAAACSRHSLWGWAKTARHRLAWLVLGGAAVAANASQRGRARRDWSGRTPTNVLALGTATRCAANVLQADTFYLEQLYHLHRPSLYLNNHRQITLRHSNPTVFQELPARYRVPLQMRLLRSQIMQPGGSAKTDPLCWLLGLGIVHLKYHASNYCVRQSSMLLTHVRPRRRCLGNSQTIEAEAVRIRKVLQRQ